MAIPLIAWSGKVEREWIDDNGHMTAMAYPQVFHRRTGALFSAIGIDRSYIARRQLTVFQREFRLGYERELMLGDPIEMRSWLIAWDSKCIHHFHELWHIGKGVRAAFVEYMSLHVDMASRRTAPFPPDVRERLVTLADQYAAVPVPEGPGKAIRICAQALAVSK